MAGKSDVVDHLVESVDGLSKKDAADAFDAVFESITQLLQDGDRVQVPKFGTFSVSERAAREGRNPATGATIKIAASKAARFKPGKDLKAALN